MTGAPQARADGPEPLLAALLANTRALLEQARATPPDPDAAARLAELGARLAELGAPRPRHRDHAARAYFQYAHTGILETDAGWRILRANPAAASITGHPARALARRGLADLLVEDGEKNPGRHLALLAEQGISQVEWHLRRADGEIITVELASIQVGDDLFLHVFDDVTEKRRIQAEVEAARRNAELANQAKSAFLANISHEIRTPMNGILGLARLALMNETNPQQRDYLEKIAQSGRSLLRIINDLLDIAKIEAGRMEYERTPFAPDELLEEAATLATHTAGGKGLELVFRVPAPLPARLAGDPLRIGQCLANLIGNAVKFTPSGRVALTMRVDGDGAAARLHAAVSDTGIGIAEEALARLFQPFSQSDAATARRFGGTGLGLAIAREMARGRGGDLDARSAPGAGSCFTLDLPVEVLEPPPPASGQGRRARLLAGRTATREAVAELLRNEGWAVPPEAVAEAADADLLVVDAAAGPERLRAWLAPENLPAARPLLILADDEAWAHDAPAPNRAGPVEFAARPLAPAGLRRALARLGLAGGAAATDAGGDYVPDEFRGCHVLVAEDNRVNRMVLQGLLERAGMRVTLAADGREAVVLALAPPAPLDLVLMDVQMPEMDGTEAARVLRDRGFAPPIVAVSAGAASGQQAECLAAGMNDFIAKPIDSDELWGVFTRWVRPPATVNAPERPETPQTRFLSNDAALARARQAFREDHGDDVRRLRALQADGDRLGVVRLAHGLKGAASTLGAVAVASLACTLERGPVPGAEETVIEALERALDDFLSGITD